MGYCANGPIGVSLPMSNTRLEQGIEEKWRDCYNFSKTIDKQHIEGSLRYCANGSIGVSSHMYKTRSKKGIEEKWGYCSNMSCL